MLLTGGICLHGHVPPLLQCVIALVLPDLDRHLVAPAPDLLERERNIKISPVFLVMR